nr:hypothetical protein [Tanacetum cinerariifolium]
MVNTRTDADLSAAVQNALQTFLPQIREEIREEFHGEHTYRCRPFCSRSECLADLASPDSRGDPRRFFPRAEQERLKREYHSIRQTIANAALNYEILHERDDDDTERPDKRCGGNDNHRSGSNNNNYSSSNNRKNGKGRDQRTRDKQDTNTTL